jgi:hypothetical protein
VAYKALLAGGNSGFNALLGGDRSDDGRYARLEAHGFYWTASTSDPASGWFYNFGRGNKLCIVKAVARSRELFRSVCPGVTIENSGTFLLT